MHTIFNENTMATVFSLLINALCVKVQVAIGIYKSVYIHT